jgi:hypothetical protein
MNTLGNKISEFVAAHKKFPTVVDFRRADTKLWEELTPAETWELLSEALNCDDSCGIAFRYWLYWLQAVRFRATNKLLTECIVHADASYDLITDKLVVSRLKTGRRLPTKNLINNLYQLYLMSPAQRADLKRKVTNSNG